jgi:hypothetical protein
MKKTTTRDKKKDIADEERFLILSKADNVKGEQLVVLPDGLRTESELKRFALGSVDNPELKYDFYYKGIMRLLKRFLPKGKENKKARAYIYEEKNTFLTRGRRLDIRGIRGADSRMAYIADIEELLNIIMKWAAAKGTIVELYFSIKELNDSRGY